MVLNRRTWPGEDILLAHQPPDPLLTDALALVGEVLPDARTTVRAPTRLVRGPHQHAQLPMAARVRPFRASLPGIEPLRVTCRQRHRIVIGWEAFSAAMNRNLTDFASRRRPWLFQDLAFLQENPILLAQAREFLALRRRQTRLATGPIRAGVLEPGAQGRLGNVEIVRRVGHAPLSSRTKWT